MHDPATGGATVYLNEKDDIGERHQGPHEAENDHEDADHDTAGVAARNHRHSVDEPAENSRNKVEQTSSWSIFMVNADLIQKT